MKHWQITWKHEKAVGRHGTGHPMYPDEWVPSLRLVEEAIREPSPCDDCSLRNYCAVNEMACRDFYAFVHRTEYRRWKKHPNVPHHGEIMKGFSDMTEGPNRTWFERLYA